MFDKNGKVDFNVNLYVMIHELTHCYDDKILKNKHDEWFNNLFAKLVWRAIDLRLIDTRIF